MEHELMQSGEVLLYSSDGDKQFVSVVFHDETFWLTQSGMAELFDCTPENFIQHLKNIYAEEELLFEATAKKFLVVRKEGTRSVRRELDHYSLDAIIAVDCRRSVLEGKAASPTARRCEKPVKSTRSSVRSRTRTASPSPTGRRQSISRVNDHDRTI